MFSPALLLFRGNFALLCHLGFGFGAWMSREFFARPLLKSILEDSASLFFLNFPMVIIAPATH